MLFDLLRSCVAKKGGKHRKKAWHKYLIGVPETRKYVFVRGFPLPPFPELSGRRE
jgi:hypothetical protein